MARVRAGRVVLRITYRRACLEKSNQGKKRRVRELCCYFPFWFFVVKRYLSGSAASNALRFEWSRMILILVKHPISSFFDLNMDILAGGRRRGWWLELARRRKELAAQREGGRRDLLQLWDSNLRSASSSQLQCAGVPTLRTFLSISAGR